MKTQTYDLIHEMAKTIGFPMGNRNSDFAIYDTQTIRETAENEEFPLLWIVDQYSTHMEKLGSFRKDFNESEQFRYQYLQHNTSIEYFFKEPYGKTFYLIDAKVTEISLSQAKEMWRDITTPVVAQWEAENGKLPKKFKVKVKFHDITLGRLKELLSSDENKSLYNCLHRWRHAFQVCADHHVELYWDERMHEFYWESRINGRRDIVGGIVCHEGGNWQSHT